MKLSEKYTEDERRILSAFRKMKPEMQLKIIQRMEERVAAAREDRAAQARRAAIKLSPKGTKGE